MAALRFFLHQDDLKAGDTGSAAQLEAQKEEEEHIKLIQVRVWECEIVKSVRVWERESVRMWECGRNT